MKAKVFEVEGFGTVGEANLSGFVSTSGPQVKNLEVGQSCVGHITKTLAPFQNLKEQFRITRLEDKTCV